MSPEPSSPPYRRPPSAEVLWSGFDHAFNIFLRREAQNIRTGVSERSLCGRLAISLEEQLKNPTWQGYYADIEYNRKQNGLVKTMMDEKFVVINITCDLIVHSRGEIPSLDNLIAIEMKKASHPESAKQADRKRLRALTRASYDGIWSADGRTHPEHVCGYRLGLLIDLDAENGCAAVEEYRSGEMICAHNFRF
jgi:hypothetical protein